MAILMGRLSLILPRRAVAVAALGLALSSCRAGVDEMRMRIDESEQGSLTAQVSADLTDSEIESGDAENTTAYNQLADVGRQLTTKCNVRHLVYPREETVYLDLRAAFSDVDDLNSTLRCAAVNVRRANVEFERHDGFLWNTFVFRFAIAQDRPVCEASGDCAAPRSFPRVVLLTVPGKIHRIGNASALVGIDLAHRAVDDDTARIELRPAANYRAQNRRHFGTRTGPPEVDEVRIEIESRVANFNLSTILSVIGMIFGSGLLIQGSRWLLAKRKQDKRDAEPAGSSEAPAGPGSAR
jgi:hypothetical protein